MLLALGCSSAVAVGVQIVEEDKTQRYDVMAVYWSDGKDGSVFELSWTGGGGHTPDRDDYVVISRDAGKDINWQYVSDAVSIFGANAAIFYVYSFSPLKATFPSQDWTIGAYQASCWHWLSDETTETVNQLTEAPNMWVESLRECLLHSPLTVAGQCPSLVFSPRLTFHRICLAHR